MMLEVSFRNERASSEKRALLVQSRAALNFNVTLIAHSVL
jgi:hypothetical protein